MKLVRNDGPGRNAGIAEIHAEPAKSRKLISKNAEGTKRRNTIEELNPLRVLRALCGDS